MSADARKLANDLLARYTTAAPVARRSADLSDHPQVVAARAIRSRITAEYTGQGLPSPFFLAHEGVNGATTRILGRETVNFSAYNYLELAGDPRVMAAAKEALDTYGTSASASRAAGGEIPLYGELESRLAVLHDVGDALVTASGYLTNAGLIPFLLGPDDLAACDALVHSSIVAGTRWAGCRRTTFRHNDPAALDDLLTRTRHQFARAMVIVEGVYSMDGDIARLPELIEVARRHDCLIMVDEAHALGTVGERGFGTREHFGLPGDSVDIWMGTLSKTLAGCGGYLAGDTDLIWALRLLAPGVSLFSAGPTPAQIAAAIAAHDVMLAEPHRVSDLRQISVTALRTLRSAGWDTGLSEGTPIIPLLLGESDRTMAIASRLLSAGISAAPIVHPAVAEGDARIRLFLSTGHTTDHVDRLVTALRA